MPKKQEKKSILNDGIEDIKKEAKEIINTSKEAKEKIRTLFFL